MTQISTTPKHRAANKQIGNNSSVATDCVAHEPVYFATNETLTAASNSIWPTLFNHVWLLMKDAPTNPSLMKRQKHSAGI